MLARTACVLVPNESVLLPVDLLFGWSPVGIDRHDKDRSAKARLCSNRGDSHASAWLKHGCLVTRIFRIKRARGLSVSLIETCVIVTVSFDRFVIVIRPYLLFGSPRSGLTSTANSKGVEKRLSNETRPVLKCNQPCKCNES
jgi:hypothetical protein